MVRGGELGRGWGRVIGSWGGIGAEKEFEVDCDGTRRWWLDLGLSALDFLWLRSPSSSRRRLFPWFCPGPAPLAPFLTKLPPAKQASCPGAILHNPFLTLGRPLHFTFSLLLPSTSSTYSMPHSRSDCVE